MICISALLLICTGCASSGGSLFVTKPPPPPPDPHTQMAALEQRITTLIQYERQKIDPAAKPLAVDKELIGIAREHSADMAAKKYLANKAPDGKSSATLIMDEDANFQGLLGENIAAQHYLPRYGVDVDVFARRFVDSWLASPAHKENLAFKDYNRTGVGAAVNGDTVYVTQLFASDLALPPPDQQHAQKREITELAHPKTDDKPAVPPDPRPSLTQ
ncbi:MAG TPA: CAP domain-containing protein [Rhizomicrobium sp.]|nr:CAP domain-containing protein [Rhizomicrobium sp.]